LEAKKTAGMNLCIGNQEMTVGLERHPLWRLQAAREGYQTPAKTPFEDDPLLQPMASFAAMFGGKEDSPEAIDGDSHRGSDVATDQDFQWTGVAVGLNREPNQRAPFPFGFPGKAFGDRVEGLPLNRNPLHSVESAGEARERAVGIEPENDLSTRRPVGLSGSAVQAFRREIESPIRSNGRPARGQDVRRQDRKRPRRLEAEKAAASLLGDV
jgi:hypothetical protein